MNRDLVIALTGSHSRVGRALTLRLRAEGHTVIPVPPDYGLLPGSDVLIHLGRGSRRIARRLPDAVRLPARLLTSEGLGIRVIPLGLFELGVEEAVDRILWAVHHPEGRLELEPA